MLPLSRFPPWFLSSHPENSHHSFPIDMQGIGMKRRCQPSSSTRRAVAGGVPPDCAISSGSSKRPSSGKDESRARILTVTGLWGDDSRQWTFVRPVVLMMPHPAQEIRRQFLDFPTRVTYVLHRIEGERDAKSGSDDNPTRVTTVVLGLSSWPATCTGNSGRLKSHQRIRYSSSDGSTRGPDRLRRPSCQREAQFWPDAVPSGAPGPPLPAPPDDNVTLRVAWPVPPT